MPNEGAPSSSAGTIWLLEQLKDRIVALFTASSLDESTKNIWCDDAKGMYYRMVHTDMLLSHGRDFDAVRDSLHVASSRYQQVRSELSTLGEPGQQLEEELTTIFTACSNQLAARIPAIPAPATAPQRVVKNSAEDYMLPCSVCGKKAVAVHPAGAEEKILKGIICSGITRAVGLNVKDREKIFAWLENGDLAAFHNFIEIDEDVDGGLDAYCPECDQIYCRTHYNVVEQWDEGFYDCTYGTCPQGHRREIDD